MKKALSLFLAFVLIAGILTPAASAQTFAEDLPRPVLPDGIPEANMPPVPERQSDEEIILAEEDYLLSVVSLYPKAGQKAQAVRLRRWLWERMTRRKVEKRPVLGPELTSTPGVVTWLEHRPSASAQMPEELPVHLHYDVCAEEHCQRYIGLTDKADASAREAIDESWGMLE